MAASLKGMVKGEILVAVGRDGNNQMFPIAWAIVEGESRCSWVWFLELLKVDLGLGNGRGWTLMSDQQKVLIAAVEDVVPQAEHRMCVRHLYANWRKHYKGDDLKVKYWAAAKSPNMCKMWDNLSDLAELCPEGYVAMKEKLHPKHWCRAFFSLDACCDIVDNNICVTFNGVLVGARSKPFITMLEDIRLYVMKRLREKRDLVTKWKQPYAPRVDKKLLDYKRLGGGCTLAWNGVDGYEVTLGEEKQVVLLGKKTCTCRRWQLKGISCAHACAAIKHEKHEFADYVADWFKVGCYMKTYEFMLEPVKGIQDWPPSTLQPLPPPVDRRMPGRPRKHKRAREVGERVPNNPHTITRKGKVMVCTLCNKPGHNKRTCDLNPNKGKGIKAQKQAKEKGGTSGGQQATQEAAPEVGDQPQQQLEPDVLPTTEPEEHMEPIIEHQAPLQPEILPTPAQEEETPNHVPRQPRTPRTKPYVPTKGKRKATETCLEGDIVVPTPAQGDGESVTIPKRLRTSRGRPAPTGFGLYVNPNSGQQILNPGRPTQQMFGIDRQGKEKQYKGKGKKTVGDSKNDAGKKKKVWIP